MFPSSLLDLYCCPHSYQVGQDLSLPAPPSSIALNSRPVPGSSRSKQLPGLLARPFFHRVFHPCIPSWYSDPAQRFLRITVAWVPKSAGLQFPTNQNHSPSTSLLTLTLLMQVPTNLLNLPDSILSMRRTANESVEVPCSGEGNLQ
jgi:hypothetical protein